MNEDNGNRTSTARPLTWEVVHGQRCHLTRDRCRLTSDLRHLASWSGSGCRLLQVSGSVAVVNRNGFQNIEISAHINLLESDLYMKCYERSTVTLAGGSYEAEVLFSSTFGAASTRMPSTRFCRPAMVLNFSNVSEFNAIKCVHDAYRCFKTIKRTPNHLPGMAGARVR